LSLQLLDGFQLAHRGGSAIRLPATCERVLAFLALHEHPVRRCVIAGSLWPDTSESRSSGSLRSALWRMSSAAESAIDAVGSQLSVAPLVAVDVQDLIEAARRLRSGRLPADAASLIVRFEGELLADWYDDWIVLNRERWRQIRLHALESLADMLRRSGDCSTAAEAGLAAVRVDPLRETAHRTLIETYLTEGNRSEALRQYRVYEAIMHDELGLEPSSLLSALVGTVVGC
jgi:DNA-binding SARP family transcriptional activator